MKFHSGTHSGTAVSYMETVNFSIIESGGDNQVEVLNNKKYRFRCNDDVAKDACENLSLEYGCKRGLGK